MAGRPRIQHVSVPKTAGGHEEAKRFYVDLLGLKEVPIPSTLRHLDLIWYQIGDCEIHLYTNHSYHDGEGRHFCIEVDDLAGLRERFLQAGYPVEDTIDIPGRPRFNSYDPFGNMIEFTTIEYDYKQSQS